MKKVLIYTAMMIMLFTSVCFADAIAPEIEFKDNNIENNYIVYVIIAIVIVAISCIITLLINKNNKKGE